MNMEYTRYIKSPLIGRRVCVALLCFPAPLSRGGPLRPPSLGHLALLYIHVTGQNKTGPEKVLPEFIILII